MADNRTHQVKVPLSPPVSQAPVPNIPFDMEYYLNEGLEGAGRQQYRDLRTFARAIQARANELRSHNPTPGQYLVFSHVMQDELTNLERIRDDCYGSLRFLYLNDAETLIVKITPGLAHPVATSELIHIVLRKTRMMGLHWALRDMGAPTYQGTQSKKEGDSALRPTSRSRKNDWPTVVIESGISESLIRLRTDSNWWLENSAQNVKIVLLISISKLQWKIHLEQWENSTIPNPDIIRDSRNPLAARPSKINEINIHGTTVTGAPLRLRFDKIFLRPPAPGEGDIVFTTQDLRDYAGDVWGEMQ